MASLSRGGITINFTSLMSEEFHKSEIVDDFQLPGEDADETILIALGGCLEEITITGQQAFTETGGTDINGWTVSEFATNLRNLANGGQTISGPTTYHSDLLNTDLNVVIRDIRISYEAGVPSIVNFQINMVRGNLA